MNALKALDCVPAVRFKKGEVSYLPVSFLSRA